jgi:CheY-like chemotaxis protein
MRKRKVLILDDDPTSIQILKLQFDSIGHEVFTGVDGLEGLVKTRKEMPDLILLDVMMPHLDGHAFFKILKEDPKYSEIPIMILTGDHDLRDKFLKMGCDYFATKPFQLEEIMAKAEELIKKHVVIVGDDHEYKEHVKVSFPDDSFRVQNLNFPNELFQESQKNFYHLAVVRLAQVSGLPTSFLDDLWAASRNRDLRIVIYSDAYVRGLEEGDTQKIGQVAVDWVKAGPILFYDHRLTPLSLSEFLEEHL